MSEKRVTRSDFEKAPWRRTDESVCPRSQLTTFLTGAVLLFVLLVGLVPFDFDVWQQVRGGGALFSTEGSSSTYPDVVGNIFLYVPVGALLCWFIRRRGPGAIPAFVLTLGSALLLSGLVEWLQAFSPARVSSLIDLVSNVVGAAVGAGMSGTAGAFVRRMTRTIEAELRVRPRVVVLKAYALVLVVFATMPFSFTFDVSLLKRAGKTAVFVPFQQANVEPISSDPSITGTGYAAQDFATWRRMESGARWAAECLSFVVFAWLLHGVLRSDYAFKGVARTALVMWMGTGLAVGLSVLQLPVASRTCDVTDVLLRVFGLGIGAAVQSIRSLRLEPPAPAARTERIRKGLRLAWVATAVYICYVGLIPFTFTGADGRTGVYASANVVPFAASFMTRFDLMLSGVMAEFCAYALFAALAVSCRNVGKPYVPRTAGWGIVGVGVALAAAIEVLQVFISVRVASLSDVLVAAIGATTGVAVQRLLSLWHGRVLASVERPALDRRHDRPELSPTDALVASLADPHPGAPREIAPTRKSGARSNRV